MLRSLRIRKRPSTVIYLGLRQENPDTEVSLDYKSRLYLKKVNAKSYKERSY